MAKSITLLLVCSFCFFSVFAQSEDSIMIKKISDEKENVVFLLWGKFAQEKRVLIDESKHLILRAAHPSPLSAHAGFFGCKHFSKANEWLIKNGIDPIDWRL